MAKLALGDNSDLCEWAAKFVREGPRKLVPTSRRVRIVHHGIVLVDTTSACHVWEHEYYPQFYFPASELKCCAQRTVESIKNGDAVAANLVELTFNDSDGTEVKNSRVLHFVEGCGGPLAGLVRVEFKSVDTWMEEEMTIEVHPKDPYKRIDILPSTRPIEVQIEGVAVAKTSFAMHLFETLLPTRFYLPLGCVDQSLLRKSDTITKCPYKGDAEYYSVVVNGKEHKDVVWYYRLPTNESASIARLVCFYNEKVDIWLDGKKLERPNTKFG